MAYCIPDKQVENIQGLPFLDSEGAEIFNTYKTTKYSKLIDALIGQVYISNANELGWTVRDLTIPSNLNSMYEAAQEELKDLLRSSSTPIGDETKQDLVKLLTNWEDFAKFHNTYNSIVNTKEDDSSADKQSDEDEEGGNNEGEDEDGGSVDFDEEEEQEGKEYDKLGNEESPFELLDKNVKILFRILPKATWVDNTAQLFKDEDGLITSTDYMNTFNLVLSKMTGTKDETQFKAKLLDENLHRVIPELKYLANLLGVSKDENGNIDSSNVYNSTNRMDQWIKFYQVFSKPEIQPYSTIIQHDGRAIHAPEIRGNKGKIEALWTNNFFQVTSPYVKISAEGRNYISSIPEYPVSIEDKLSFLSILGMNFTYQNLSEDQRNSFNSIITSSTDRLYNSIQNRLEAGQTIYEPIKDLRKSFSSVETERKSINDLVNWESNFSNVAPSLSFNNTMGEKQYAISLDNQISAATTYLNQANSLEELFTFSPFRNLKYNPQFKQSRYIKFLFDEDGNKIPNRRIHLENYNGLKQAIPGTKKFKSTIQRGLSESQKFIQDFNNTLTSGFTDVMRTETSHSFYALGLQDGTRNIVNYSKGFEKDFKGNSAFSKQMISYAEGELERIKSFPKKKEQNPTIPDTYGDFSIFSFLPEEVKTSLKDSFNKEDFLQALNTELEKEVDGIKSFVNRNGLVNFISPDLLKDSTPDNLIRAFVANTFVQNVEFSILYSGDTLFFKDMHKRLKGLSTTGNLAATLSDLQNYLTSNPYEVAFRQNYSLSPKMRDNSKDFRTKTITEYKPTLSGVNQFDYTRPELRDEIRSSVAIRDSLSPEEVLEKYSDTYFDELLRDASKQKPADGQGYINLDFHRELAHRHGFWNPDIELAYKYEGLIYKRDILGQTLSSVQNKELSQLEKKIYSSPDSYSIPVLKLLYYGPVENSSIDAKAYDKFSVFPILPSIARNHPKVKDILTSIVEKNYGYIKYESGTKLFTTQPADIDTISSAEPDLFSTELIKEVIKTKSYVKSETAIPTQLLKLIFSNLFSEGVPVTPQVEEEYNNYISTLSEIQKGQVSTLLKDLGYNSETSTFSYERLSDRLQNEIKRQGLNSNISQAVLINPETGRFNISAEATGVQDQIQSLIAGIADKTLRRFKLNGGDFVLVSNANFKPLKWYKYDKLGTKAIEVRISLTKGFAKLLNKEHPDKKPIGTIERLNSLLKSPTWVEQNKKSLTIILDRVPTQGPNSMDFGIVTEFLSPTGGNIIQLPEEIVYKSGTDFDYDKEKIILPSFTEDGIYIDDETLPIIKEKIRLLEDEYSELRDIANVEEDLEGDLIDNIASQIYKRKLDVNLEVVESLEEINQKIREYFSLKNNNFTYLSNKILETYVQTLSSPEMFAELITPNNTLKLKPIADRNAEELGNSTSLPQLGNVFFYSENLKVFKTYFDAKSLLGAFATDNTHQQLLQYAGTKLSEEYNKLNFNGTPSKTKGELVKKKINLLLLSPEEKSSILIDGKIDVSKREDVLGNIKQHWDSEAINATVDAAKDPWFASLNINWYNVGIVNLLKNIGHDMDRVTDFVNNPILRNYYSERNKGLNRRDAMIKAANSLNITKKIQEEKVLPNAKQFEEDLIANKNLSNILVVPISLKERRYEVSYDEKLTNNKASWDALQAIFTAIDNNYTIGMKGFEYLNERINNNSITPERLKELKTLDRNKIKEEYQVAVKSKNKQLATELANKNLSAYSDEIRILSHFFEMDNHNYNLRDFQRYFNFDTKKISTPLEIKAKDNLETKIRNASMFSPEDFQKMKEKSIISSFINNSTLSSLYSNIFTLTSDPNVADVLSFLYTEYTSNFRMKNKRDERTLPSTLNNDFIFNIIQNFGEYNDKNIFTLGQSLLVRETEGQRTTASRLLGFKKTVYYPEIIRKFPILANFVVNNQVVEEYTTDYIYDEETKRNEPQNPRLVTIQNIQLIKSSEETKLEQEALITQLRDLYNFEYSNPSLTTKQVEAVNTSLHTLIEELFIAGIVQSGFGKTYLGYQQYIPIEFKTPIYQKAIDIFSSLGDENKQRFISNFNFSFRQNNPKYFQGGNPYSHRLKIYKYDSQNYLSTPIIDEEIQQKLSPPIPEDEIEEIEEIKRASKKTKYSFTLTDGIIEEREGYKIIIPNYTSFNAYITGSSKEGWSVDEISTNKYIGVTSSTIKDILPELQKKFNTLKESPESLKILQSIGLFTSAQDLPTIERKC